MAKRHMAEGNVPRIPRAHKSPTSEVSSTNAMTPKRGEPHGRVWLAVAVGLFALGSIGSAIGANAVGHADGQRSRQAFASTSTDIALILQRSLRASAGPVFQRSWLRRRGRERIRRAVQELGRSDSTRSLDTQSSRGSPN